MKNFTKLCVAGETKTLRHAMRGGQRDINRAYASLAGIRTHFQNPPGPSPVRDDALEPLVAATYMVVRQVEVRTVNEPRLHPLAIEVIKIMDEYIRHREMFI